jgi:hypothetical protein
MRKTKGRLGSLLMVMVLLLSTLPMTVLAVDEEWIEISDVAGLISISSNLSGNYRLTADIDLAGAEWNPIGPFSGKLDGSSKVIRNFTINDTSVSNKGLFSSIEAPGQISNLGIENANITAGSNAGILAGTNSGTINRSYTKGSVNGYEYVGGLVGHNLGTIENSYTQASVSGKDYLGGLAGVNSGIVQASYAASSLLPSVFNNYLQFNGTPVGNYSVQNSGGYIDIPHNDIYVGDKFTLEAWFQWDDVGTSDINFIMGKGVNQFEIHTGGSGVNSLRFIPIWTDNADSFLDVKNAIQSGWFHVATVYEYNSTTHQATAQVFINGEAQDLWNGTTNLGKTAVIARDSNTLGYGKVSGTLVPQQNHINIGRRTDGWFYFDGKICDVRFWNIARTGEDIKRDKDKVLIGNETGLVGYWKLNEASGDAIDSSTTHNNGTLAGDVVRTSETAAIHKGGLIGDNTGTVSDSCYDSEVSGQSDTIGTSKSTADMKLQSTFTDWDFNNIWGLNSEINSGYPYLLPEISAASVTMTAPAAGAIPQAAVQVETATSNADYTVSNVVWNEALTAGNSRFKAGQVYTANVTLTSKNGKLFRTEAFTPVVAGSASAGITATNGTGVGNTVTFTVTFPATAARTVTGMQIKNQSTDLIYTEGESLNLAGLEVTLTYNDSSTKDVAAADFAANGITASPVNGTVLTMTNHNGHTVTLTCNGYNAITSSLTVNADTRTITGYYTDNSGSDTAFTTTVTVPYGTAEEAAKAGLSTSGYAKLSDNSYVPVTIAWNFNAAYDGNSAGVKAVTGTVAGTFPGGQVPTNSMGTVTVEAAPTYTIAAISDQTMTAKTAGYGSGTQETRIITVTKTGTGDLANMAVSLSGGGSSDFVVTQPPVATLNSGTPFTTFTVKAKDGLAAGTYTGTLTVSADNMTNMTFAVTQVVNSLFAPAIQSAVAGNEHVVITWNNVNEAAGYKIFCSNASGSYGTELATVSDSVCSYDATGLTNGTTYYFVIKASNGGVDSDNSNEMSATPQAASPGAPVLQSANAGDGHVNVSWSGVAGSTGYKVYTSTTSGSYTTPATTVAGAVYSYDITGLTNGTIYYFAVKATNPGGDSAYSNEISAIPQVSVPAAPTGPAATAGNAKVTLNWDSVAGATGYKIYQSTTSGSYGAALATVTGSACSYEATGLTNGVTYYFVIKATNAGGDSPNSAEAGSMPKTVPGAPTNVTPTAGNEEAAVSFAAPADNGGSTITGYTVTSNPGNKIATGISGPITVTGLTNGTTYTFTVTATNAAGTGAPSAASSAVTPHAQSSGGGGGGSSTTTQPTTQPLANTSADILVNGKTENAGSATTTTTTEGNQTVTTIAVDEKELEQKLEAEGSNAVVTITVNTKADIVVGELNGQIVQNMGNKQAVLEVKTENATYTLPAQQINISVISEQFGSGVELKDIKVQVEIAKASGENVQLVENSAKQGEFSIIAPPVEFSVKCTYEGKTVEVSSFNAYVERTIAIPDGIDPNKITTGIIVDPEGTTRHVPTRVMVINGKYYAVINSLTNSLYLVVWNPLEFKDAANHWAKEAINDMGSRMVISGVGNGMSEPDRDITRAEFAAIIVKALGLKPGTGDNKFTDVNSSDRYCDYIKTAAEYKIISGYGNGKFGPNDKITREQTLTMIARTMNIIGLKAQFANGEMDKLLASFRDAAKSEDYARDSIAVCVKTGIISGRNGNLIAPKENITRAEVAVIVRRLLLKSNLI